MEFQKIDIANNRIDLIDSRFYEHDGEFYPSVTTILEAYPKGAGYFEWLKKVGDQADEIRNEFGRRGSTVHHLTEAYDRGEEVNLMGEGLPRYSSLEWAMFERYVEFSNRFTPEIEEIELNLVSPELGFGGTLDRVIGLKGELLLIDIKTSNYIHPHYWLQLAAYEALYGEVIDRGIDGTAILWLNSKHRTEGKGDAIQGKGWALVRPEKSTEEYWQLFQATHKLWLQENAHLKPRNVSYKLKHQK